MQDFPRMRYVCLAAALAGLLLGAAIAVSTPESQSLPSAALVTVFVLSNCVPDETTEPALLGSVYGILFAFLGYGSTSAGLMLSHFSWPLSDTMRLPLFFVVVTIFHLAEFTFAVVFHPHDVNFRAFLLTPVPFAGYSIAMVSAIAEFWTLEGLVGGCFPRDLRPSLLAVSFCVTIIGWALRTAALFTAKSNFTHQVANRKTSNHRLVVHGVYRLCRHPGYLGWFIWSVSSQLILGNVLCVVAYAVVAWRFFAGRIPHEEDMLMRFFGREYMDYATRVPCGLPWISQLAM